MKTIFFWISIWYTFPTSYWLLKQQLQHYIIPQFFLNQYFQYYIISQSSLHYELFVPPYCIIYYSHNTHYRIVVWYLLAFPKLYPTSLHCELQLELRALYISFYIYKRINLQYSPVTTIFWLISKNFIITTPCRLKIYLFRCK